MMMMMKKFLEERGVAKGTIDLDFDGDSDHDRHPGFLQDYLLPVRLLRSLFEDAY